MATFSERQFYWADQLTKADDATRLWIDRNYTTSWGTSAKIIVENIQKIAQRARLAIQNPQQFPTVDKFDSTMKALLDGIYSQLAETPPKWSDPFVDTATDVANAAKPALTWGAGGIGLGVVLLAALYFLPWKR